MKDFSRQEDDLLVIDRQQRDNLYREMPGFTFLNRAMNNYMAQPSVFFDRLIGEIRTPPKR